MIHYDYIIAGAGASGLSLVLHMIRSGRFIDKRILIVDRVQKTGNDKTWCFWEHEPGFFESIVHKRWKFLWFHGSDNVSKVHSVAPYEYKMIRSIDFYEHCFSIINGYKNIDVKFGTIADISSTDTGTTLSLADETFSADYIFSSIFPEITPKKSEYFLVQHFKGWTIETQQPIFDPELATLMDFRVDQKKDCRFVYVMPLSGTRALVEYTGFSEYRLEEDEYKTELAHYCLNFLNLPKEKYEIVETEFGMIPMTNFDFPRANGNVIYIGTAGGQTKASTGYTFNFIQKHSAKIVESLLNNERPVVPPTSKKFGFYDSILLKILSEKKLAGAHIFAKLFGSNEMKDVFKFLDNETSLAEDVKLISSLPTTTFLTAALSHLVSKN